MNQLPMIFGIGPRPSNKPPVPSAPPFRAEVQTDDGVAFLGLSFEAALELNRELEIYVNKYAAGR